MKNGILSIPEWDMQLAIFLNESNKQRVEEHVLDFYSGFLNQAIRK